MLALCCRLCFSVVLLVRAGGVQQKPSSSLQSRTDFSPRLVNNIIGTGWGTSVFSTTINTVYCTFRVILLVISWLFDSPCFVSSCGLLHLTLKMNWVWTPLKTSVVKSVCMLNELVWVSSNCLIQVFLWIITQNRSQCLHALYFHLLKCLGKNLLLF